jgi:ribonuclease HI
MSIGNIFCDASMDTYHRIGCAGIYLVSEDFKSPIDCYYVRQFNATNNSAEILAIYHAVLMALYYRNRKDYDFDRFRIFSDSKICIYGLREWIYGWVNNQNADGLLKRSDDAPVLNQSYFKEIVRLIIDYNLPISFVHQKGHMNLSEGAMRKAEEFFYSTNGYSPKDIGADIRFINAYNIEVDTKSRELLHDSSRTHLQYESALIPLVNSSEMIKFNTLTHWI